MEALQFRHDIPRYLATRLAHRIRPTVWYPRLSPLRLFDLTLPEAPGPDWARLEVQLSGICGSDVKLLSGGDSLYLEPEASYPFVPGHEIVAKVASEVKATGPDDGDGIAAGTRVGVWPVLGCRVHKNGTMCPECRDGWDGQCRQRGLAWPGRGITLGHSRETSGGWSESCLAHRSQLWPLPDTITDEDAVLLDPAATALASLLRGSSSRDRILVIGGGPIGLLTALLHRELKLPGLCHLLVRHEHQLQWAQDRGLLATRVRGQRSFLDWAADEGITSRKVQAYGFVHHGNFDHVIDAAGTRTSLRWSMAAVRSRGTVMLLTAPNDLRGIDATPFWYREITLRGVNVYGPVPWQDESVHPYSILIPRLADGRLQFRSLISHRFSLADHAEAFNTAMDRGGRKTLKIVLSPTRRGKPS